MPGPSVHQNPYPDEPIFGPMHRIEHHALLDRSDEVPTRQDPEQPLLEESQSLSSSPAYTRVISPIHASSSHPDPVHQPELVPRRQFLVQAMDSDAGSSAAANTLFRTDDVVSQLDLDAIRASTLRRSNRRRSRPRPYPQ